MEGRLPFNAGNLLFACLYNSVSLFNGTTGWSAKRERAIIWLISLLPGIQSLVLT